ncbi:RICIN domain-containing protein [Streptomyces sp. NRRL F-5135]|uniref:RICIN domain-containing protein n=1 Tax=Streptomyces sp. NRRL F-5135 TaxID=1463858 RepID=UPI0005649F2A|nr:RICIN domain-containing protein [Streptomyces sp. NRRL F-5135]
MSSKNRNWVATSVAVMGVALALSASGPAASAQPEHAAGARAVTVDRLSLRLASDPGQLANVKGGGTENGAPVIQYPWTGGSNERWDATATGNGYYRLASVRSGKCLNVRGGGNENGAEVIQYTCGSGANEQWKFVPKGKGYQLVVRSNGKCLNVKGGVGQNNPLIQYTCTSGGAANDVWLPVWEPAS